MCKMQLRVYGHIFSLDIYINGFIKTMTNVKLAPYFNATSDKKTTSYCCQPILHLYLLRRSFLVLGTLKLLRYLRSETNFLIPLFQKKIDQKFFCHDFNTKFCEIECHKSFKCSKSSTFIEVIHLNSNI